MAFVLQSPVQFAVKKFLDLRRLKAWNALSFFEKAIVRLCQNAGVSSAVASLNGGSIRGP